LGRRPVHVYPGFTQQWIAVIYGQAFFLRGAVLFDWADGLAGAAAPRSVETLKIALERLLALALSGFTMFSTEYFFGLELLRPVLLWLVFTSAAALSGSQLGRLGARRARRPPGGRLTWP
jgi:hypothetical protein